MNMLSVGASQALLWLRLTNLYRYHLEKSLIGKVDLFNRVNTLHLSNNTILYCHLLLLRRQRRHWVLF